MRIVIAAILLFSSLAHAQSLRERLGTGLKVGSHQGGIFNLRGNTLNNFEAARKEGADIIETDLRTSRDGIPFLFHNDKLDKVTTCRGLFATKTSREIKNCFLVSGDKIPSFEDALLWSGGRVIINAEFKDLESIHPAISLVQKYGTHGWVYFQTKDDPRRYNLARSLDYEVSLLFAPKSQEKFDWVMNIRDDNLLIIELEGKMFSPEKVNAVHAAGRFVSANSFYFSRSQEYQGAKCKDVYKRQGDIAITNKTKECVKQRNQVP